MRLHPRLDANHNDIVNAYRAVGVFVQSLAAVGGGCPDLLCSYRGLWFVVEVKDGEKVPSKRRLTDDEQKWHVASHATVHVVNSVEEALQSLNTL